MTKGASRKERILAGLDIGSSKVAIVVGLARPEGLDIVGVGQAPSPGIRNGMVVNIEATTDAISKAKEEAELMSGYPIEEVWLAVSGAHIQSFDSKGMIAIKNKEVRSDDVLRVLEAAKTINVPLDRQVLHVIPREFKIDEQEGISDPIGMSGVRLEAAVHIVTGGKTALQNLVKSAEHAGLKVVGVVLQQLASALAVLSDDERKLGVALVDIGAGTSDVVCFVQGSAAFTGILPVGGQHFTQDIAVGLRTPQSCAEIIKKKYGSALNTIIDADEMVEVEGVGGRNSRTVARSYLCEVIEPRAEETLGLIKQKIESSGLWPLLGSGIVMTGGGSSLQGLVEMGEYVFEAPVRLGAPEKVSGLKEIVRSPNFSTVVGVLFYAYEKEKGRLSSKAPDQNKNIFSDVSRKIKDFFEL